MQDLDNTTFDRIVGQGLPVLVRIDKEYPYGDTDDAWKAVGAVRPTPTSPLPTTCTGWWPLTRWPLTRACTGNPATLCSPASPQCVVLRVCRRSAALTRSCCWRTSACLMCPRRTGAR